MRNEKENGSGVKEKCTGERKKQSGEMDMMEEKHKYSVLFFQDLQKAVSGL